MLFIAVVSLFPIRILDAKGENNHNQDLGDVLSPLPFTEVIHDIIRNIESVYVEFQSQF